MNNNVITPGKNDCIEDLQKRICNLESRLKILDQFNESSSAWETFRDSDQNIIFISPVFERLTGYDREPFIKGQLSFQDIVHPEDQWKLKECYRLRDEHQPYRDVQIRIISKEGGVRYTTTSSSPVYSSDGSYIGSRIMTVDITKIKDVEIRLEESQVKFRTLFENSDQGIILMDDKCRVVDWNHRLEEITGISFEKVKNEFVWDIAFSQFKDKSTGTSSSEILRRIWATKLNDLKVNETLNCSGEFVNANGEIEYFEESLKLLKIGDRNYYCSFQNYVTYQKKIEQALKDSKEKFEKIFRFSPFPLALIRCSTMAIVDLNKAYEIMVGLPRDEIIGKTPSEISGVSPDRIMELKEMLKSGKEVLGINFSIFSRTGRKIETSSSISQLVIDNEEYLIVFHSEITELKNAEADVRSKLEELKRLNGELEMYTYANNELKQITYAASHQLQEPARTINNYTRIIEEDYSGVLDEDAMKYLFIIRRAAQRMTSLVNQLLDYSSIGRKSKLVNVDCNIIVSEVIKELSFVIHNSGAVIEVDQLPRLDLYQTEFRILIHNLLDNALKFKSSGARARIRISCCHSDGKYIFSVRDNGIGINSIHKEKIFDIFQRLHPDETEYEGKGIGLALCKKIARLHNGDIWLEESGEGSGSKFCFTIPGN
jgi:PAS domain S-box-containing protein